MLCKIQNSPPDGIVTIAQWANCFIVKEND